MTDDEQRPVQKGKEPDANAIKMFVGQVPKTYDEKQLLEMFEAYGPVFQLNILKDKVTGHSRGELLLPTQFCSTQQICYC